MLTTHYLEEAEALCTRIAMLKGGRIVALDTTQALLARVGGVDLEDAFVRIMHQDDPAEPRALNPEEAAS
ncbi:ABC transporter ATP-binding protein [Bordetella pertussis]|nr:ABC transporter ATP-binding protein [Bordetella pertussis]CPI47001.1 ABC transporter ATP-binding protein [Bordetella pertussis]CPK26424.1 ABC transporter ATP-binding protein [Bordetella pertussis]CZQ26343.1 ABC transporter ATP-binding protein [Bordetella pertussis]VTP74102.1 ABC transporter ATP-binding protein [Bordetella pertussis]